jgi:hypothetical protein
MNIWIRRLLMAGVALSVLLAAYVWFMLTWNYSSGERAGWVQKFSHKGWLCKTWEGEMAMVSMPGTTVEKFFFTVRDPEVVEAINRSMGKRVALHYEEKMGVPSTCFGETRYFVSKVISVVEGPTMQGIAPPVSQPVSQPVSPPPAVPSTPAPAPAGQ